MERKFKFFKTVEVSKEEYLENVPDFDSRFLQQSCIVDFTEGSIQKRACYNAVSLDEEYNEVGLEAFYC